jgi:NAD(P)H dehydrogenase (quinone)
MNTVLVTAANGDTGRATLKCLLEKSFKVRAFVRKDDDRARSLRGQGVEVAIGDISSLSDVRLAMSGVQRAYF